MCGFQLLTAQKPISRPGWWKGKFGLFQVPATVGGGRQASVQRLTFPQPPAQTSRGLGVGESINRVRGGGLHAETKEEHSRNNSAGIEQSPSSSPVNMHNNQIRIFEFFYRN